MTTVTRDFHIGDVISITSRKLVSPRHMEGIYGILNFMTGDNLFTHQLPRAADECRPALLAQHPWLADIDASCINRDNWREWLDNVAAMHGKTVRVAALKQGVHAFIDPLAELAAMVPAKRIVVVG